MINIEQWLKDAKCLHESMDKVYSTEQCLHLTSTGLETDVDWSIAYTWLHFWAEIKT